MNYKDLSDIVSEDVEASKSVYFLGYVSGVTLRSDEDEACAKKFLLSNSKSLHMKGAPLKQLQKRSSIEQQLSCVWGRRKLGLLNWYFYRLFGFCRFK